MNITSTYPVRIPLLLQHGSTTGKLLVTSGCIEMKFLPGRMLGDTGNCTRELHGEPGEPCCRLEMKILPSRTALEDPGLQWHFALLAVFLPSWKLLVEL